MRKKKQSGSSLRQCELNNSVHRTCMIEKWMQKKQVSGGGGCEIKAFGMDPMLLNSSSNHQILAAAADFRHRTQKEPKHHESNGFIRSKSKAMKIYSDLKTVKQPISPGGKLASFINSLFTSPKKTKNPKNSMSEQQTPTSSSASSRSYSCLPTTKTTSSKGNAGTVTKRSVRFCPVSVILDEDSRPCGELKIRHENKLQTSMRKPLMNKEIEYRIIEENCRVAEAARELLNSYRKQKNEEFYIINIDEDNDDDDAASYASSDLFELDNLYAIGNERYLEELPVYETTHFDTNRAMAKGLIL
ncbi:dentin sialophosphoprotein-like [Hibiscus syriacus]|uniref:Dentin sialophosphoprotein-like n=1 Tax=Hibiscus syriacus TaxID=106335 RepID=A0A6A2XCG0_HIBSY|nr:dentin sialophosphoprotein-like [Hibiscus syriacus]